jgi:hypothetical protein
MTIRSIALYLGGMLALACFLLSLVTVVPDAESLRTIAQGVCAAGALVFGGLGMLSGWLSPQHWVNRSRTLQGLLMVLAAGLTLFLLFGVVG